MEHINRSPEIVSSDEMITSSYAQDYQPIYPDVNALDEALAELQNTTPVTNPENILELKKNLSSLALGQDHRPIIMLGPCAEEIRVHQPINLFAESYWNLIKVVEDTVDNDPLIILRSRGQSAKPRSQETEILSDGREVLSYYGDMINGIDIDKRTPDPSRMVASAIQARDIEEHLLIHFDGRHIPAAHEALLLPYESSFIKKGEDGKRYLLSTDLPWIGERTRSVDSKQTELLSKVENPIGIKIGPEATKEDIAALSQKLNPDASAGKLSFMLRLGVDNLEQADELTRAIKTHAANQVIISDPMHGNTKKTAEGIKTRLVSDITTEIKHISKACRENNVRLHGVHLEAVGNNTIKECINNPSEQPKSESLVDPQLNLAQLKSVLDTCRQYI